MQDIGLILKDYATENGCFYASEYESGWNVIADKFFASEEEYAVFQNILETAVLTTRYNGGFSILRTIEVTVLTRSRTKDDEGEVYAELLLNVQNKCQELFGYLINQIDGVENAQMETDIDKNDATLVAAKLIITINESVIC